jgi:hypothetical protein
MMQRRIHLFKEEGFIPIDVKEQEKEKIEGTSLYICCLKSTCCIRKFFFKLVKSSSFETVVIVCIIISTLSLAFNNPMDPNSSAQ